MYNNQNQNAADLKRQLQQYSFSVFETALFLDSHPDNAKAISYYNEMRDKLKEITELYEEQYGPLTIESNQGETWEWVKTPWPWESEAN